MLQQLIKNVLGSSFPPLITWESSNRLRFDWREKKRWTWYDWLSKLRTGGVEVLEDSKKGLCFLLWIDIYLKNGLPPPLWFAHLPSDLKMKIAELLPGLDVVNGCIDSEMIDDEVWENKSKTKDEQFLGIYQLQVTHVCRHTEVMAASTWKDKLNLWGDDANPAKLSSWSPECNHFLTYISDSEKLKTYETGFLLLAILLWWEPKFSSQYITLASSMMNFMTRGIPLSYI